MREGLFMPVYLDRNLELDVKKNIKYLFGLELGGP